MHINQPSSQLDHMLRQTRMNLVAFSQMADTKAHIILSLASVLLSLSLTQITDPRFTLSIAGLDLFLLITIFFALLTVIGKIKVFDRRKHSVNNPDVPVFGLKQVCAREINVLNHDLVGRVRVIHGLLEISNILLIRDVGCP